MIDPTIENIVSIGFPLLKQMCEFNPSVYIKELFEFSRRFALQKIGNGVLAASRTPRNGAVSTSTLVNGNYGWADDSKQHAESVLKVVANNYCLFSYQRKSVGCISRVLHCSGSKHSQKCFRLIQFRLS